MSNLYDVKIPVAGYVKFTDVEAESEEEAIEIALDMEIEDGSVEELCMYESICDGCNDGCNGDLSNVEHEDADATLLDEEDEEDEEDAE